MTCCPLGPSCCCGGEVGAFWLAEDAKEDSRLREAAAAEWRKLTECGWRRRGRRTPPAAAEDDDDDDAADAFSRSSAEWKTSAGDGEQEAGAGSRRSSSSARCSADLADRR